MHNGLCINRHRGDLRREPATIVDTAHPASSILLAGVSLSHLPLLPGQHMEENQDQEKAAASGGGSGRGPVRAVCVFCGSRPGNRPSFSAAALDLGGQLVS
jgi:hypothetical protein